MSQDNHTINWKEALFCATWFVTKRREMKPWILVLITNDIKWAASELLFSKSFWTIMEWATISFFESYGWRTWICNNAYNNRTVTRTITIHVFWSLRHRCCRPKRPQISGFLHKIKSMSNVLSEWWWISQRIAPWTLFYNVEASRRVWMSQQGWTVHFNLLYVQTHPTWAAALIDWV